MSGSGGASPSRKSPPLPPDDATELLPPGSQVVPPPIASRPAAGIPATRPSVPATGFEQTVALVKPPPVARPKVDSLLPPGSEAEPGAPPVAPIEDRASGVPAAGPPAALASPPLTFFLPGDSQPVPQGMPVIAAPAKEGHRLSMEERDQLRFWKNAAVFGIFLVVLMVVCWWLAR